MVLIISENTSNASIWHDILHYAGIPSDFKKASNLGSTKVPFRMGLIIENNVEEEYLKRIKRELGNLPLFAVCEDDECEGVIGCFNKHINAHELINECNSALYGLGRKGILEYSLFGIDASIYEIIVRYFGKRIHLTKSETLVLRTLIAAHPSVISAKDILALAFKEGRKPNVSSVRTHICSINKRFNELLGDGLICSDEGGYKIKNPNEMKEFWMV